MLSNKQYDILTWVVALLMPSLGTLIGSIGEIWGFTNTEPIVLTINAVATFLGAVFMVSKVKYNKDETDI